MLGAVIDNVQQAVPQHTLAHDGVIDGVAQNAIHVRIGEGGEVGAHIAFFFTGEHPDYHANTDSVEKILFPKLVRIAQFIYQSGFAIANSDRTLERDNKGPRAGKGFTGGLLAK